MTRLAFDGARESAPTARAARGPSARGDSFAPGARERRELRGACSEALAAETRPAFAHLAALTPSPPALYPRTLAAYVDRVSSRARAIYQVGRVRGDGLSDLDLIVVPGPRRFDDGQFYSARLRVPGARRLFPHDARPLPFAARDAIRFTSHADRRLVFGDDVLAGLAPATGPEQDLSLLLEGFLKYARFLEGARREGRVHAERLVSKATSLTYSLALFDRVAGGRSAPAYATASLGLRRALVLPGARPELTLAELWGSFASHFGELERALAKRLPCVEGEPVAAFARSFLRGERIVPGLDRARLAERRAAVAHYHAELARSGLFIGSLFAKGAYGADAGGARERRASPGRWTLGKCLGLGYRLAALG